MFGPRPAENLPGDGQMKSVSSPIGGLNTRDSYASMPETDAVDLVNWIPDRGGLRCRKGYSEWFTNLGAEVRSVFGYFSPSTVFPGGSYLVTPSSMPGKLFAATDAGIYDVTTTGSVPSLAQGLSSGAQSGWIETQQMTNSGGTFLLVTSETDGYYTYDGAAWLKVTLGGGANQVSGVNPATFTKVLIWKRRAWFVVANSTKAAYLPADALYGAATAFDFGPVFKNGGRLAFLASWTVDAGEGMDDFLVAVSNLGDVAVYKGTDPASATTFALVGTWQVGQIPEGARGHVQYGGDLVLLGANGVYPISYVTRGGADFLLASSKEYTSKISPSIGADLRASFTIRGWQMMVHPSERLLVVSVPNYSGVSDRQWAMSTTLNAWTSFVSMPMSCMGWHAGYMFSGDDQGRVLLALNGVYDNVPLASSSGAGIEGTVIPAFSNFGSPMPKQFVAIRPVFVGVDSPAAICDISVNYSITLPSGAIITPVSNESQWNSGLWNSAVWGGTQQVFADWFTAGDEGFVGTATLKTVTVGDTVLAQFDYILRVGNVPIS